MREIFEEKDRVKYSSGDCIKCCVYVFGGKRKIRRSVYWFEG